MSVVNKYFDLTNLNKAWVITKRHNGNLFFKRKAYITCKKNYPTTDCVYIEDEQIVKTEVENLNKLRKKCKYGYENASKYFVNKWIRNSWSGSSIHNNAMAIKEVNVDTKLDSPESLLLQLIESKKYDLSRHQSKLQEYDKSFAKDMDALKLRYDTYKKDTALEINGIEQALSDLTLLNLEEIIAPYETQGDRMVKVLYGSNK